MNGQELRTVLDETAAEVDPPADVVSRARRGGRRRLYRRRGALAGGLAAVVAVTVAGGLTGYHVTRPAPAHPVSTVVGLTRGPTHGNLADHDRTVTAARHDYAAETHGGKAHLAWISHTRYGDVAIFAHLAPQPDSKMVSVITLTRSGGARFQTADAELLWPKQAGLAEPVFDNRAVFVLDFGTPAYYSTRHTFTADATRRVWHRVAFGHGSAMLPVARGEAMVVASNNRPSRKEIVSGQPLTPPTVPDQTLGWGPKPQPGGGRHHVVAIPATPGAGRLPWARHGGAANVFVRELTDSPFDDPLAYWPVRSVTPWVVYGQTPAGKRLVIGELQYNSEPSHIYALIGHTMHYVGASDRSATLPVQVKLPDGGWAIAAKGKALAYRDGDGWHDLGRDAALVPAGITQVRVGTSPVTLNQ